MRCRHASGTEAEYAAAAFESGFEVLGFADHCPWPFKGGYESRIRMLPDELAGYVGTVRELGREYAGRMEVRCGLECEYYPDMLDWLAERADEYALDYLILGNHYDTDERRRIYFGGCRTPEQLRAYADRTTRGMATGMFSYLAHPDLCFRSYMEFDAECAAVSRELCRCAIDMDMPLEYNLLGKLNQESGESAYLGYPCTGFWDIAAQEGVKCVIGVDAHEVAQLSDAGHYTAAVEYLRGLGLERVERIKLRQGADSAQV